MAPGVVARGILVSDGTGNQTAEGKRLMYESVVKNLANKKPVDGWLKQK